MADYLHPSVKSRIINNSYTYTTSEGTTTLFAAGVATKGPDNILTRLTNTDEASFVFGEPDMSVTGQTLYNVFNWLKAGGEVYFIRVLPSDAQFANAVISVGIDEANSTKTVVPLLNNIGSGNAVGTSSVSVSAIKTILNTEPSMANTSSATKVLGDGHHVPSTTKVYPLLAFVPMGRGSHYNGVGIRLTVKDNLDSTYSFRTYNLEVTMKDSTGADAVVEGPYTVSFESTAKDRNRESLFVANVLNKYSRFVNVVVSSNYVENLDAIRTFINPSEDVNPLHIDFLFGKERSGVTVYASGQGTSSPVFTSEAIHHNAGVKFATLAVDNTSVANPTDFQDNWTTKTYTVDMAEINYFGNTAAGLGGTDGTWTGANSEDSLLVKAYSGEVDSTCLDKKQVQLDVLLDGNTATAVKNAMAAFTTDMRDDCMAILDCGFQSTPQQTIDYRKNSIGVSTFSAAIFGQDAIVYDSYTGQNIKVTMPYFLASKIPSNDNRFGVQWSFTGPRRGVISGFEEINFFPNEAWKESLYKAQVNYVSKDPKRINFDTQLTSETVASALSNINNVRALFRIKRDVEQMMDDYRDEFNDSITHQSMSYNLSSYLQRWVSNRTCKRISGSVYASDYDRQQKIARVKVELSFNNLIERIYIDFIVNR